MSNLQLLDEQLSKHFCSIKHKCALVLLGDGVNEHCFVLPDYILNPVDHECEDADVIEYAEVLHMNFQRLYYQD